MIRASKKKESKHYTPLTNDKKKSYNKKKNDPPPLHLNHTPKKDISIPYRASLISHAKKENEKENKN